MKILILSSPRAGSHAFTSIQPVDDEYKFYECMNIEDLILPRNINSGEILYDSISSDSIAALNEQQFDLAYDLTSEFPANAFVVDYDKEMRWTRLYEYPDKERFLNEHQRRWNIIKDLDQWCIKIIQYQGVPELILNDIASAADKIYILQRRDKIKQAISLVKTNIVQIYHTSKENTVQEYDAGQLNYKHFREACATILSNDTWNQNHFPTGELVYYEDIDFKGSYWQKNNILLAYDQTQCQEIVDEIFSKS
jgi:hypothetical protein